MALNRLKSYLESIPGQDEWMLLTNLTLSVTHQLQSDEIDMIVIGPPGVLVVEVKHWTAKWVNSYKEEVERAADLVTNKARKIGTTLRKVVQNLGFVEGLFLLTQKHSSVEQLAGKEVRGVRFHTLKNCNEVAGQNSPAILSNQQIKTLSHKLEPRCAVTLDGSLRRLAGYTNLELQTPREQRFHRIYKGKHTTSQDRMVLHLYDLSASSEKNLETKARREFEALHKLQLYTWAPRILDSYQNAPGYAGEMCFFTIVDPAAPSIEKRAKDASWNSTQRLNFARDTVHALGELHKAGSDNEPIIHRNLTTKTILVRHDDSPILTSFSHAKIPMDMSIASGIHSKEELDPSIAPEIRLQGISMADRRSDVYSLCACLITLFKKREDGPSLHALEILNEGLAEDPNLRPDLERLENSFSELLGEPAPDPDPPPARFWTEEQIVPFGNRRYRIVSHLGSGGVGKTFKVVEINRKQEDLGTYIAKVVNDSDTGNRALRYYSLARPHLGQHPGLSTIFEVAPEWRENGFVALMNWIEGSALGDFTGVFPLLAEDQRETSEGLATRWLRTMCGALDVLHENGLAHGDVSPRNMIVSGSDIVLTDYDFVTRVGDPGMAAGTALYSPPFDKNRNVSASDDIYALASSIFHVMFEKEPFLYNSTIAKERGLNWEEINRVDYPVLADFLDKATHPDPERRFASSRDALAALKPEVAEEDSMGTEAKKSVELSTPPSEEIQPKKRAGNQVPWLRFLLQSYPGSLSGNSETRGLDTEFASRSYVPTDLEKALLEDVEERNVRLVVLCGNAGDGKTALLQSLAIRLGFDKQSSSKRILQEKREDGLLIRMNLDGSAAWQGRSADELLDEFLEPFQQGFPKEDIAHLLAINDGRLLEWAERKDTPLTRELMEFLEGKTIEGKSHIRFINLNQRSLVGGIDAQRSRIKTGFLDKLVDKLYGDEEASELWKPCLTCKAQTHCEVFQAMRVFGPDQLPELKPKEIRGRARERLFEALQSVHFRGETHVTIRELRSALVYILFGVYYCDYYHEGPDETRSSYWDQAFSPDSPARQGELLRELVRFDPALEAHPKIDRHLLRKSLLENDGSAPHYKDLSRESARRRAYFEWTPQNVEEIGGEKHALGLAQGRHLHDFRNLPFKNTQELEDLCRHLCMGISRLEELPPQALGLKGVVPLRITPRTPTETKFWVGKPLSNFRLEADIKGDEKGLHSLHRQAFLVFRYRNGREEKLRLGAELFHLLLELSNGYQLGDISTDDTFAHLSVFVQRLVREDERKLFAWNPMREDDIHEILVDMEVSAEGVQQQIVISTPAQGD